MLIEGANYVWDEEMQVPYLVQGDQWVGFDDEKSIRNKMKWIQTNGYAGAMVWSIDMDAVSVAMSCFSLLCEEADIRHWIDKIEK